MRLWNKLFFISDFVGTVSIAKYLNLADLTKFLVICFVAYYIMVKVVQQMIFRARMYQSKAVLAPHWYPFIGNYVALGKCTKHI